MRVPLMIAALLSWAVLGCGGGGGQPTAAPTTPGSQPTEAQAIECNVAGTGTAAAIKDFAFNPSSITVAPGGQIDWTNGDSAPHTVSFDSGPDCGTVSGGATTSVLFNVAGTYPYHCNIHSSMKGTVIVQ